MNLTRRATLRALAALGIGTATFQRALANQAARSSRVTAEMVREAEWIAGIELSDEQRESAARGLGRTLRSFERLRAFEIDNAVAPALVFDPVPPRSGAPSSRDAVGSPDRDVRPREWSSLERPTGDDALAFLPVSELAALVRRRGISSTELTKLYLDRLRRHDEKLLCVVNLTEDRAIELAKRADAEIAGGRYRGPLHGIPWGAKDLIAYPGYPTSWGSPHHRDQRFEEMATVARRLEDAGAVIVAKLSLGALAMGDRWYRGMTRNPWDPDQGSSGSSAGSSSATVAGLVGFALGSETLGSIVSPCTRCGATGLRPTFGRVSRHGCMALSWSMDKIGPICRSVEDCALVFGAIHGFDGLDASAVDRPFRWPAHRDVRSMVVGHFEDSEGSEELAVLRELGVTLRRFELPDGFPLNEMRVILRTEAAAAFDDVTRKGVTEGLNSWPEIFRQGHFVPAVEYLRANRIRSLLQRAMREAMRGVDAYVDVNRRDLVLTNLTGNPCVVMPNGFRRRDNGKEVPTSITFTGRLFGETDLLALADAYQRETGFHLRRPVAFKEGTPGSR